ncbi:MAG: aminotransferase class III-fold pyridoxal phosphate-dependent enzyme [Dehalococcoidia bacterium]|nr:aminotransferase class III-fold pyridoxal phosphate-dependent enzyme [Dehalococcoidia bacterium]
MTTDATASSLDWARRAREHLWVQNKQRAALENPGELPVLERGDGIYLWDVEGRRYIDGLSGLWVTAAGHGRQEIADVAREQMANLAYASTFDFATPPAIELAEKIASLAPGDMDQVYFTNSGSESVEVALKIAKQYHYNRGDTKRYKVISRIGSYHGQTHGALSVNGASYAKRAPFEPLLPGSVHVPGINCYRCPFEKTYPECDVFCARTIEDRINFEKPETVAAIIAEPISIANGNYVPAVEYWRTLRDICDRHGILLIADEVINGFGRTGRWFGVEHFGITPDLMTTAKGISSGYIPLGAVIARQHVADAFLGTQDEAFSSGLTFGSHPVSTAVGLANVNIIEREGLVENAARQGEHLRGRLDDLAQRPSIVGEARGIGLLWGIELVRDKQTREKFDPAENVGKRLTAKLRDRGILTRCGRHHCKPDHRRSLRRRLESEL